MIILITEKTIYLIHLDPMIQSTCVRFFYIIAYYFIFIREFICIFVCLLFLIRAFFILFYIYLLIYSFIYLFIHLFIYLSISNYLFFLLFFLLLLLMFTSLRMACFGIFIFSSNYKKLFCLIILTSDTFILFLIIFIFLHLFFYLNLTPFSTSVSTSSSTSLSTPIWPLSSPLSLLHTIHRDTSSCSSSSSVGGLVSWTSTGLMPQLLAISLRDRWLIRKVSVRAVAVEEMSVLFIDDDMDCMAVSPYSTSSTSSSSSSPPSSPPSSSSPSPPSSSSSVSSTHLLSATRIEST